MCRHIGIAARINGPEPGFQQLLFLIEHVQSRSRTDAQFFLGTCIGDFCRFHLQFRGSDGLFGRDIAIPGLGNLAVTWRSVLMVCNLACSRSRRAARIRLRKTPP